MFCGASVQRRIARREAPARNILVGKGGVALGSVGGATPQVIAQLLSWTPYVETLVTDPQRVLTAATQS
jgi:hypothetical protein